MTNRDRQISEVENYTVTQMVITLINEEVSEFRGRNSCEGGRLLQPNSN
jgi:hypothetical protein